MNLTHFGIAFMSAMFYAEATAPHYGQLCLAIKLQAAYQTHNEGYNISRRGFITGCLPQYGITL